jgi:dUTP pyrophosphatase
MILDIVRVDKSLPLPEKASAGSAGYDLRASIQGREGVGSVRFISSSKGFIEILPNQIRVIPLGIKIGMDLGYVVNIFARSGLSIKDGVTLINGVGVIDADYRGELMAGLINLSDKPYTIKHGDRICQMVAAPVIPVFMYEQIKLQETTRGEGGLGSSGKN